MTITGKSRLSPSKATWCVGQKVDTIYENSCTRYVVWERRFEKESDIDPLYKALGDIDELRYANKLNESQITFQREQEFIHPIIGSPVTIEGRYDFKLNLPGGPVLVEKKSVTSPNRRREIFTKGLIDPKQLAQLVSYMAIHKISTGRLEYTFWGWDEGLDALIALEDRTFEVTISIYGDISVDGIPFNRHVRDLQTWYRIAAKAMEQADQQLAERPLPKAGWQNPCKSCPLADACTQYDSTHNVAQFWHDTQHLSPRPGKPAEILIPKRKKGKKNEQTQFPASSNPDNDSGRIRDQAQADDGEIY